jgi:hypothetical protein
MQPDQQHFAPGEWQWQVQWLYSLQFGLEQM